MLYLESVIGAELAGKLGMLDDAAKTDDILKSDGIDGEQISDVIDDMLPDGSDVANIKKVEEVLEEGLIPRGTLTDKSDGLTVDERRMIEDLLSSGKCGNITTFKCWKDT